MGKRSKTTDLFKSEIFDLVNDEYTLLSEYVNAKTHVIMRHNKCLNEYPVSPNHFLNGRRCPKCSLGLKPKENSKFVQEFKELVGEEYSMLSNYVNSYTHIKVRHNKCNHEYSVLPSNFTK